MELVINGDKIDVPDTVETVDNLIQHFGLSEKVVIVEQNQIIVEKGSHQETKLCNGDKIELVHFVGGG
ncbi:sulfur carrier protein ThiS [Aquibacillus sp. 3ASR75-11]|uniref:Sulfur carrier protein ThiS n=1 Tax=Terrihalobacillus insolitus TaxID=2950438 RepID=A0A9X3WTH6_9BACI|nr:sulfur carrier protein ThiS [Terrihalobacillus insolitus]MDC3413490.1 sulfur carrier protein ThiS [Terrihalobacillus insolitus]MDC3425220.1 sulfur carrier protein ThiS [Terrihalobacillus insolitus]